MDNYFMILDIFLVAVLFLFLIITLIRGFKKSLIRFLSLLAASILLFVFITSVTNRIKDVEFDIVIKPEMSFGTAHHPTTAQLISYLLKEDCAGKKVLDMGTGTGVLAILAQKRKAASVLAIDNDKWAYNNCVDNVKRNDCNNILVQYGDASLIKDTDFDIVIANINRNILLKDMKCYARAMKSNAVLFLSGFYLHPDLDLLKAEAEKYGIEYQSHSIKDEWVAARLIKK